MSNKKLLITGGAGFIGSAVIRHIIINTDHNFINVDKLPYAGNLESFILVVNNARYIFEQGHINKEQLIETAQPLRINTDDAYSGVRRKSIEVYSSDKNRAHPSFSQH
jgi:dTDP-D-glucose 4,6-dehydratase